MGCLGGLEGKGSEDERKKEGENMRKRIEEYAAAPDGKGKWVDVYVFKPKHRPRERRGTTSSRRRSSVKSNSSQESSQSPKPDKQHDPGKGTFDSLVSGIGPQPDQRIVYVDGGFDLFSSGHIAFLESVTEAERKHGEARGWFAPSAQEKRIKSTGFDYPPAYVVAGVHDDEVINFYRGLNYPIMNIFERGLCVVQCRYIHCVIFSAPFVPSKHYLSHLPPCTPPTSSTSPRRVPDAVYHGPTSFLPPLTGEDPFADAKALGVFQQVDKHRFQDVNSAQIVQRILHKREEYEERQKNKGAKAVGEEAVRREELEQEKERELLKRAESWKLVEKQFGA